MIDLHPNIETQEELDEWVESVNRALNLTKYSDSQPRDGLGRWSTSDSDQIHSFEGMPFDTVMGEKPHPIDTPPQRTAEGHFVVYHGTSKDAAKSILKERTVRHDDLGAVGFTTTQAAATNFAAMKHSGGGSAVLRMVIDKDWMAKQNVQHEVGGSGHDQFLISLHRDKAQIPPEALHDIRVVKSYKYESHKATVADMVKYSPDQERDDHGRWTADGAPDQTPETPDQFLDRMHNEREARRMAEREITHAVVEGRMSIADATAKGWYPPNARVEDFKPLPAELYHLTTAKDAVMAEGLRTKAERSAEATGLGGGNEEAISTTYSQSRAWELEAGMREVHHVLNDPKQLDNLITEAKAKGYWDETQRLFESSHGTGAYERYQNGMHRELPGLSGMPESKLPPGAVGDEKYSWQGRDEKIYGSYDRPATEAEKLDVTWDMYRMLSGSRERAGGAYDPYFAFVSAKTIKDLDPDQIAVLRLKPNPGALGTFHGEVEKEWRIYSGKSVRITDVIQHKSTVADIVKYSDDQPRDDHGRWTSGGSYTSIDDIKDQERFLETMRSSWKLPDDQRKAVQYYIGNGYDTINSYLRGQANDIHSNTGSLLKNEVESIDKAIADSTLPRNLIVYRGIDLAEVVGNKELRVGSKLSDRGFVSTSLNKNLAEWFARENSPMTYNKPSVIQISVPKGTNGLRGNMVDREILLPRGSTLEVTGMRTALDRLHQPYTLITARYAGVKKVNKTTVSDLLTQPSGASRRGRFLWRMSDIELS